MAAPAVRDRWERFDAIARSLDPSELQRESGEPHITGADVLADLSGMRRAARVLGYYSPQGIERAFESYGLLGRLRARGFRELALTVDPADASRQVIRIHGTRGELRGALLMALVVRRQALDLAGAGDGEVLSVEWLLLQDPTAPFSPERPRLPGQEHPGLGLAHDVQGLLVQAARRLGLEGLASRPSHYHFAVEAAPDFRFLDPRAEGRFRAMRRALAGFELEAAAWIVADGRLVTADGHPVLWEPSDQVLPLGARLRQQVLGAGYDRLAAAERARWLDGGLRVAPRRR